jgi:hypothetical protein
MLRGFLRPAAAAPLQPPSFRDAAARAMEKPSDPLFVAEECMAALVSEMASRNSSGGNGGGVALGKKSAVQRRRGYTICGGGASAGSRFAKEFLGVINDGGHIQGDFWGEYWGTRGAMTFRMMEDDDDDEEEDDARTTTTTTTMVFCVRNDDRISFFIIVTTTATTATAATAGGGKEVEFSVEGFPWHGAHWGGLIGEINDQGTLGDIVCRIPDEDDVLDMFTRGLAVLLSSACAEAGGEGGVVVNIPAPPSAVSSVVSGGCLAGALAAAFHLHTGARLTHDSVERFQKAQVVIGGSRYTTAGAMGRCCELDEEEEAEDHEEECDWSADPGGRGRRGRRGRRLCVRGCDLEAIDDDGGATNKRPAQKKKKQTAWASVVDCAPGGGGGAVVGIYLEPVGVAVLG